MKSMSRLYNSRLNILEPSLSNYVFHGGGGREEHFQEILCLTHSTIFFIIYIYLNL